jgi:hypothetical protein
VLPRVDIERRNPGDSKLVILAERVRCTGVRNDMERGICRAGGLPRRGESNGPLASVASSALPVVSPLWLSSSRLKFSSEKDRLPNRLLLKDLCRVDLARRAERSSPQPGGEDATNSGVFLDSGGLKLSAEDLILPASRFRIGPSPFSANDGGGPSPNRVESERLSERPGVANRASDEFGVFGCWTLLSLLALLCVLAVRLKLSCGADENELVREAQDRPEGLPQLDGDSMTNNEDDLRTGLAQSAE